MNTFWADFHFVEQYIPAGGQPSHMLRNQVLQPNCRYSTDRDWFCLNIKGILSVVIAASSAGGLPPVLAIFVAANYSSCFDH